MEDTHICNVIDLPDDKKGMLFAVFDGHGGDEVAIYAKAQLKQVLEGLDLFKKKKYEKAL